MKIHNAHVAVKFCKSNWEPAGTFATSLNLFAGGPMQAQTGAATDAVQNLRRLLSIPAGEAVSIARLKIDPVWDPIRNDPGFQQLLAGKELVGPNK